MDREIDITTIRQAQAGNMQSRSAVAEQVRRKVDTYIYRLTLDYHLTQDLTQETVLEMLKSLSQLEVPHVSGFWGWVFRTALGKVQHHFRLQGARRLSKHTTSDSAALESYIADHSNAMDTIIREEVRKAVLNALKALEFKYRNILILRCFENLSYGQIAVILGGSELKARLLFFRAKRSLKNQMERHGFKRDSLLAVLTMFASLTIGTGKKAAAQEIVLASSLETGLGLGFAGLLTARTAIIAAGILMVAGLAVSRIKPADPTPTTSEEIYAHLYPLLDLEEFVPPSNVIAANDPNEDGLLVIEQSAPELARQRLPKDNIPIDLVNQPRTGLVLPENHWVELGFDGPLHDGPGPDILVTTRRCRYFVRVFVTDGSGKVFELPKPQCLRRRVCGYIHILDFDLKGLDLPFEPHAVRVMGILINDRVTGVEFYSVRARIRQSLTP